MDVPVGETTHLNCSVVGSGDAAQISCVSQTSGSQSKTTADPYGQLADALQAKLGAKVYHLALVVGSNHVGYVVSCISSGGLLGKRCYPLSTGQVLKGSVQGDKLSVSLGTKTGNYTVETSAYIGPLATSPRQNESTASPTPQEPSPEPSVKLAVEKSGKSEPGPGSGGQANQPDSPANTAKVLFSSEPSGADVCVDGNFIGSTPSQIQLAPGSHTIRIEAKGQKPWSRTVTLTAGGKVTLQAVLTAE